MEFKFNLGQRVVVPGTKGLQGIVIGRKEFLDAFVQPEIEVRWLDDAALITSDTWLQDVLERAQPGYVATAPRIRFPEKVRLQGHPNAPDGVYRVVSLAQPKKKKRPAKKRSRKKSKSRSRR